LVALIHAGSVRYKECNQKLMGLLVNQGRRSQPWTNDGVETMSIPDLSKFIISHCPCHRKSRGTRAFSWNSRIQASFLTSQLMNSCVLFSVETLHTRAKTGSTIFRYHPTMTCTNPAGADRGCQFRPKNRSMRGSHPECRRKPVPSWAPRGRSQQSSIPEVRHS